MHFSTEKYIAQTLWDRIKEFIPPICQQEVAQNFIEVFEEYGYELDERLNLFKIAGGDADINSTFVIDSCPSCGGLVLDNIANGVLRCEECGKVFAMDDTEHLPVIMECPECGSNNTELVDFTSNKFIFSCDNCGLSWYEDELNIDIY